MIFLQSRFLTLISKTLIEKSKSFLISNFKIFLQKICSSNNPSMYAQNIDVLIHWFVSKTRD